MPYSGILQGSEEHWSKHRGKSQSQQTSASKDFPKHCMYMHTGQTHTKTKWVGIFLVPPLDCQCVRAWHIDNWTFQQQVSHLFLIVALLIIGLVEWYHIFFILVWFYPNTVWLLLSSRTVSKIPKTSCLSTLILHIWASETSHGKHWTYNQTSVFSTVHLITFWVKLLLLSYTHS